MKKLLTTLMAFLLIFTLTGCRNKKTIPNENRSTNHKYDFIDYFEIKTYGEDGKGYLYVVGKDITLNDFESEEEYIAVKKDLDNLGLVPDKIKHDSRLVISKTENLSNGDIVDFSIKNKYEPNSDINIETYQYVVEELGELEEVDLFDDSVLFIYALENSNKVNYKVRDDANLPKDILENIEYKIETDDKTLRPNQTVLTISASLKDHQDLDSLLAYNGLKAKLVTERVLTEVVEPADFTAVAPLEVENAIYRALLPLEEAQGRVLNSIGILEKIPGNRDYEYVATYASEASSGIQYYKTTLQLIILDGQVEIPTISYGQAIPEKYFSEPFEKSEVIFEFEIYE